MYGRTQFLVIFFALEVLLLNANFEDLNVLDLWKARFYYLYDKQMTSNVAHLQDKSLDFYEKYIKLRDQQLGESAEDKKEFALLLVEHSHCLLAFYKYKQAKQALKRALSLLGLNLKLTGKLGRRTKFQEFDIA